MKNIIFGVLVFILVGCGGGGTSAANDAVDSSITDILVKNKKWYGKELNNKNNVSMDFSNKSISINEYSDKQYTKKSKNYKLIINSLANDEFSAKMGKASYDCSVSNITYEENGCVEIECINLNGDSDLDNLNFNIFNRKENAIKYSGSCYN